MEDFRPLVVLDALRAVKLNRILWYQAQIMALYIYVYANIILILLSKCANVF